jgi:hypothetical protein
MFVLRCVVLMMNFSGRPATLTIPFASNRTGRTFRASMSWDAPMSGLIVRCSVRTCLWAYGRWVNMNGSLQHLMAIAYIYSFQVAIRIVSVSLLAAFRGSKNYQRIRFDGGSCKPHLFQGSSQAKPSKPDMKSVPNHFTWLDGTTCSHDCYMNANGFMPLQTVYCTCAPVQIDISLTVSVCIWYEGHTQRQWQLSSEESAWLESNEMQEIHRDP